MRTAKNQESLRERPSERERERERDTERERGRERERENERTFVLTKGREKKPKNRVTH